jgi:hypothetical protein
VALEDGCARISVNQHKHAWSLLWSGDNRTFWRQRLVPNLIDEDANLTETCLHAQSEREGCSEELIAMNAATRILHKEATVAHWDDKADDCES